MGRYILHLVHELAARDTENVYILYVDVEDSKHILPDRFKVRALPSKNYLFWEQVLLPRAVLEDGVRLLHCPANTAPVILDRNIILVMTIHDVMYMHTNNEVLEPGNLYQWFGKMYRRFIVPRAARRAQLVMTDSHFSKKEIGKFLKLQNTPVEVVHLGCEFGTGSGGEGIDHLRVKYGIAESFILAFGGVAPRKNTRRILEVFSRIGKKHALQLVVTAIPKHVRESFTQIAHQLKIESSVIFLEFLPEEELQVLLTHSQLFLFLSKYEGFGLPVIEAMHCRTPVIASNLTSIPEVAGGASYLVNPDHDDEVIRAIEVLLTNPGARTKLIEDGVKRSQEFSWGRTAEQVLEHYEKLLSNIPMSTK
ncbi:MAG: glycosyltransferase family 4 protein [Ignavibacteriae bacterium]|nr:glycosyltransferase family 4 protein [Ignavibacteria bacterium]MBI3364690.1 glycosyltransferase family 4 protein [Ignavibacteriota bacterium]